MISLSLSPQKEKSGQTQAQRDIRSLPYKVQSNVWFAPRDDGHGTDRARSPLPDRAEMNAAYVYLQGPRNTLRVL